ncbi:MAG TPA: aspartyl protease family protein [Methylomirabilota bacterium]|nr:aspartyl protease family protein [Methylomirabilota bacterium]
MMVRALALVAVTLLLLGIGPAAAQGMYRWVDENGDAHIASRIEDVPEQYRGRATSITQPGPKPHESCSGFPTDSKGTTRVPFSLERQHMVIVGCINDKGPFRFMFDTGWAGNSAVSPEVLERLGVNLKNAPVVAIAGVGGVTSARVTMIRSLQIGNARLGPMEILAYGLFREWDGILGADFTTRFIIEIDNKRGILTLTPR